MGIHRPQNGLSLCAGAGGLDMGLMLAEPDFHTRCFVEWDEHARERIIAAQRAGYFAPAPIWDDVTTFDGRPFRGAIDTILAGYPCQPFSHAGQRRGENDERHLWPDIARIIREIQPRWVFLENVAGHVSLGAETVLRELWDMGFTPATGLFSAEEVGAPHERLRWFCVAYKPSGGCGIGGDAAQPGRSGYADSRDSDMADPNGWHTGPEREQRSGEQRFQPEGGRTGAGDVDDASHCCRRIHAGPGAIGGGAPDAGGAGRNNMADPRQPGPQGREQPGSPDQRDRAAASGSTAERGGLPLFPPGPGASADWSRVLQSAPHLAPSASARDLHTWARSLEADGREWWKAEAEPEFCRMVDGLAARTQPLKILGNGVVPLCAAYAWRELSRAHGLEA